MVDEHEIVDEKSNESGSPKLKSSPRKSSRQQSTFFDQKRGTWRCRNCGWTYPNPNPDHQQRRKHKKHCERTLKVNLWLGVIRLRRKRHGAELHDDLGEPPYYENQEVSFEHSIANLDTPAHEERVSGRSTHHRGVENESRIDDLDEISNLAAIDEISNLEALDEISKLETRDPGFGILKTTSYVGDKEVITGEKEEPNLVQAKDGEPLLVPLLVGSTVEAQERQLSAEVHQKREMQDVGDITLSDKQDDVEPGRLGIAAEDENLEVINLDTPAYEERVSGRSTHHHGVENESRTDDLDEISNLAVIDVISNLEALDEISKLETRDPGFGILKTTSYGGDKEVITGEKGEPKIQAKDEEPLLVGSTVEAQERQLSAEVHQKREMQDVGDITVSEKQDNVEPGRLGIAAEDENSEVQKELDSVHISEELKLPVLSKDDNLARSEGLKETESGHNQGEYRKDQERTDFFDLQDTASATYETKEAPTEQENLHPVDYKVEGGMQGGNSSLLDGIDVGVDKLQTSAPLGVLQSSGSLDEAGNKEDSEHIRQEADKVEGVKLRKLSPEAFKAKENLQPVDNKVEVGTHTGSSLVQPGSSSLLDRKGSDAEKLESLAGLQPGNFEHSGLGEKKKVDKVEQVKDGDQSLTAYNNTLEEKAQVKDEANRRSREPSPRAGGEMVKENLEKDMIRQLEKLSSAERNWVDWEDVVIGERGRGGGAGSAEHAKDKALETLNEGKSEIPAEKEKLEFLDPGSGRYEGRDVVDFVTRPSEHETGQASPPRLSRVQNHWEPPGRPQDMAVRDGEPQIGDKMDGAGDFLGRAKHPEDENVKVQVLDGADVSGVSSHRADVDLVEENVEIEIGDKIGRQLEKLSSAERNWADWEDVVRGELVLGQGDSENVVRGEPVLRQGARVPVLRQGARVPFLQNTRAKHPEDQEVEIRKDVRPEIPSRKELSPLVSTSRSDHAGRGHRADGAGEDELAAEADAEYGREAGSSGPSVFDCDIERVMREQTRYDLLCSHCGSLLTSRIITRKRKRISVTVADLSLQLSTEEVPDEEKNEIWSEVLDQKEESSAESDTLSEIYSDICDYNQKRGFASYIDYLFGARR